MNPENSHKTMFTLAAIYNFSAALLFLLLAVFRLPHLEWFLNTTPSDYLWFHLFFGCVVIFGIGYYWAGQDVLMNRNIIKMGVMGKLIVFFLITKAWLAGTVTVLSQGAALGDLIFSLLFIRVLIQIDMNPRPGYKEFNH